MGPLESEAKRRSEADIAAIAAAGKAGADILQGGVGTTQQAYIQAARELAGIGSGYTGALRGTVASDRASADAFAESQGAPAPAPATDVGALSDTLYHGGVGIPGSSLESQGAAATAEAQGMVGAGVLKSQEDVRSRMNQGEQELLDLAAKRPELKNQILDELYKRETEKLQARISKQELGIRTRAQTLYERQLGERVRHDVAGEKAASRRANIAEKNYQLQVSKHQFAVEQAAMEGRTIDAPASKAAGHLVAQDGSPILDNRGNQIPVATGPKASSKQQKTNVRMAGKAALSIYQGTQPGHDQYGVPTPPQHPMTFVQAQTYLVNTYGISRSKARQLLRSTGWKPDGKRQKSQPRPT